LFRSHERDAAPEELWLAHEALQRRIAAIARAVEANALLVDDALLHEMQRAIRDVVLHGLAPLPVAGIEVLAAKAHRGSGLCFEHCIATAREELRLVDSPRIAAVDARPGASVDVHDERQVLPGALLRHREPRRNLESVACLVRNELRLRHQLGL